MGKKKVKQQVIALIEGLSPGRALQMKDGTLVLRDGKVIGKVTAWNIQDALAGKIQVIAEVDSDQVPELAAGNGGFSMGCTVKE